CDDARAISPPASGKGSETWRRKPPSRSGVGIAALGPTPNPSRQREGSRMTSLVAVDIGGTNARFALAAVEADGTISVGEPVTLPTSDYASLQTAWEEFERRCDAPVPRAAAIAIAGPVTGETVRMTNNSWVLRT